MIHERLARQHRILKIAILRQAVYQPMIQLRLRLSGIRGKPERGQVAKITAKPGGNQTQHLLHNCIRIKPQWPQKRHGICSFPIIVVIIPLPSDRIIAVHQQPGQAAHVAVKIFHPQLFAPRGPALEQRVRGNETVVGAGLHRNRAFGQGRDQPPFARFGGQHTCGAKLRGTADQLADN